MKYFKKYFLQILILVVIVVDMKLLQRKFSTIEFLILMVALLAGLGLLLKRLIRRGISPRYDRKPKSAWNSLNDGVDPTL